MKRETGVSEQYKNVIRMPLDANFFFERAVHSLERHHYEKALKYFRLAVEKEPSNPVNYCNLAGVLSEMGRFAQSNEVLRHVTEEIAPDLVECYFYMANNSANMSRFEEAERYILHYLRADPAGEFAEEADELLHMIAMELGRAPQSVEDAPFAEWMEEHDRARLLLEEGEFASALALLKVLVDNYPDCTPARNHLALAYYYCGEMDEALNTVYELLEDVPGHLPALCHLAFFYYHLEEDEKLVPLVAGLKKCLPLQTDDWLKVSITMGLLAEHETAYTMFRRLLRLESLPDAELCHHAAAAAFNTARFERAEHFWKQAARMDQTSGIPEFYLAQLPDWRHLPSEHRPVISYHYKLPFEEPFRNFEQEPSLISERLRDDPAIRASFFWALSQGDRDTKLQAIQALGDIGDEDVERVLRDFLLRKEEDDYLKRVALFVLRHMDAKGPFAVWLNGRKLSVKPRDFHKELPVWHRSWQTVVDSVQTKMGEEYDVIQCYDAEALWLEFLRKTYPSVPLIRKAEGWAAALEYTVAKMYGMKITQHEIARKYRVSPATVGRHAREIETICGVFQRMKSGIAMPFHQT